MNKPFNLAPGVASISSPGSVSRQPYTYEHVSLDDYVETACPDCDDGEVSFIALDSTRYEIGDCPTCDGTHKVEPYCQCGQPVTGGAADGDNGVCHACNLVFHRDDEGLCFVERVGWELAEQAALGGLSGSHPSGHARCAVDGASRVDPGRKS